MVFGARRALGIEDQSNNPAEVVSRPAHQLSKVTKNKTNQKWTNEIQFYCLPTCRQPAVVPVKHTNARRAANGFPPADARNAPSCKKQYSTDAPSLNNQHSHVDDKPKRVHVPSAMTTGIHSPSNTALAIIVTAAPMYAGCRTSAYTPTVAWASMPMRSLSPTRFWMTSQSAKRAR